MEDMEMEEIWGYYDTTPEWLPVQVNTDGEVIVVTE